MGYTAELKTLIKKVEATRAKRVEMSKRGEDFEPLTLDERARRLRYHPDYNDEARRELRIGPGKGERLNHEFVDMLEARSWLKPGDIDLSRVDYETDILVIGGGGAGTCAALRAQEMGCKVLIATKLRHGDANTMMAEGGMQAATKGTKDSPYFHFLDTLGGGHFKNKPDLVRALVTEAPVAIEWLESLGVLFSKDENGLMTTMHGGGTSRKRMHFAGDMTGAEIMRTVRDEARNRKDDITVIEFSPAIELLLDDQGRCAGAVLWNMETEEYLVVKAKATIMATGGSGRLHIQGFMTTNHYGATADGIVMAYRAGVGLSFLHSVQYHPTGAVFPEQTEGLLITEKIRGAGAHVLNADGEQFVFEREPRDVEAASFIRECTKVGKGISTPTGKMGVWLDSPMIEILHGEGTVKKEFPNKFILFKRHGIDISKEPMLVYPTLHYQNGGLIYGPKCETSVPGLFSSGEVSGGVHGENRLMGNSLLDVSVNGRIAGKSAAEFAQANDLPLKLTLEHVWEYDKQLAAEGIKTDRISPMLLPDYTNDRLKDKRLRHQF